MQTRERGSQSEEAAAQYLISQGMKVLERNFHCRTGEIDLIGRDRDSLVFVEVRSRRPGALVDGVESVNFRKQRRLIAAARFYLHRYGLHDFPCRFDVIGVTHCPENGYDFDWIPNAFNDTP